MIAMRYAAPMCLAVMIGLVSDSHGFSVVSQTPRLRLSSSRPNPAGMHRIVCQVAPNDDAAVAVSPITVEEGVKPIATGGTNYATLPKKEITPLFLIPSTSVVGRGDLVGDQGFDPMGLATDMATLKKYREAELKHGRLAMLAAVGWPIAEELQGPLSKLFGQPDLLVKGCANGGYECAEALTRVPSVLNGGLDKISPIYWLAVIGLSAAIEAYALQISKKENYLPGDLGFDPLNLYAGKTAEWKRDMQLKELNNGRLAMIAVTGYAFNEAATKISVIKSLHLPQL